jgi:hypothetical protein
MDQRIVSSIEEAMAARGLKHVAKGGDLRVNFHIAVSEQAQYISWSDGFPGWGYWGWGWGGGFTTTTVIPYYEGTLVINMVDANHNQLVFQGASTQTVSSRPSRNSRKLAKAVNEVFEKFPPQM